MLWGNHRTKGLQLQLQILFYTTTAKAPNRLHPADAPVRILKGMVKQPGRHKEDKI